MHGMEVGVVANNGVLSADGVLKASHFVALCNQRHVPIVFFQVTPAAMWSSDGCAAVDGVLFGATQNTSGDERTVSGPAAGRFMKDVAKLVRRCVDCTSDLSPSFPSCLSVSSSSCKPPLHGLHLSRSSSNTIVTASLVGCVADERRRVLTSAHGDVHRW